MNQFEIAAEFAADAAEYVALTAAEAAAAPNPVVKSTALRAYPGWTVRAYADGTYDGAQTNGLGLTIVVDSFSEAVAEVRAMSRSAVVDPGVGLRGAREIAAPMYAIEEEAERRFDAMIAARDREDSRRAAEAKAIRDGLR